MQKYLCKIIVICSSIWLVGISLPTYAQLNTDRITAIGRNALYFDDYVLSIQYFNQVIKLKPYLSEPYLLRAIAKIQLGDYTGAMLDCISRPAAHDPSGNGCGSRCSTHWQRHSVLKMFSGSVFIADCNALSVKKP